MAGHDALMLAIEVLQRARRADRHAGIWEASDVQWWWRRPRPSDGLAQLFWVDDRGRLLGAAYERERRLLAVRPDHCSGRIESQARSVWARALEEVAVHAVGKVGVPVSDDDVAFVEFVEGSGLVPGERDTTAWMDASDRPSRQPLADGFSLVDRRQRRSTPHPMCHRNGDAVEERLGQCPLYDPGLDLAVETVDGQIAGYSLYWFDPTTKVGLVEPVRVEDDHQRRGLARAMLSEGIDRLAEKGAERVKISYGTEAAAALYQGVGFHPTSTTTWYESPGFGNPLML